MIDRMRKITFPAHDGHLMGGELAVPEGEGPWPAVLVLQEAFGLNDDIREKAERFAELGYVALAPALFDRPGFKPLCIVQTFRDLGRGGGQTLDDLDAARRWLTGREDVDSSRMGAVGFCLGGGFALLLAVRAPLNAAAVFYGAVPQNPGELEGVCPTFAAYGVKDRTFRKQGRRLRDYLGEAGVPHEVKFYRDAGHSFMNRHNPVLDRVMSWGPMKVGYSEEAAADAWARMGAFFDEHLRREPPMPGRQLRAPRPAGGVG